MDDRSSYDCVVIGAGIVGLAIARAWIERHPKARVAIFDKETHVAEHASGRNSGVLHAGFYYAPDSLKARLTRQGNLKLRAFCAERGVPVRETGKVVVAQSEDELAALRILAERGAANGVPVEVVDEDQLRQLEPRARTWSRALWSPSTAVADPVQVVRTLADDVRERGVDVRLGARITEAGPGWVRAAREGRFSVGHVINAGGLYADTVAHWFGVGSDYRMLPFKGLYWYGNWAPNTLLRHVYPVPDARNPFLGVHLTVTVDGRVKIGPTAIPALRREDYGPGWAPHETAEILGTYPKFLASRAHDVPSLLRTEIPKLLRRRVVGDAQRLVPSVTQSDFTMRGRPGVRAQLFHLPTRRLEMDFVVRSGDASTHVLNAVSPAWTSALAVGEYVVDGIHRGDLRSG